MAEHKENKEHSSLTLSNYHSGPTPLDRPISLPEATVAFEGNQLLSGPSHQQDDEPRRKLRPPSLGLSPLIPLFLLLVMGLAFLLASFPARNSDLWIHLAQGRVLSQGNFSPLSDAGFRGSLQTSHNWLYDLLSYLLYSCLGGPGLVFTKALLTVGAALIMFRLCKLERGWVLPTVCTSLAVLTMSNRLLLHPTTVSYFLLALTLWLLRSRPGIVNHSTRFRWASSWQLVLLFILWANLDSWFVVGLATVALAWLGQVLDEILSTVQKHTAKRPDSGIARSLLTASIGFVLLCGAGLVNPSFFLHPQLYLSSLIPAELRRLALPGSTTGQLTSPFQRTYFEQFGLSPAALAYFPLLFLGALSFVFILVMSIRQKEGFRWSSRNFLPWLGLALLSGLQVRAVPFFAVFAGPVLCWNLQDFFNRQAKSGRRQTVAFDLGLFAGRAGTVALILVLLFCAWPGWLQTPPFEPRRLTIDQSVSLQAGAQATRRWHQEMKLGAGARGLHVSKDSLNAFAWFCPEDEGVLLDQLAADPKGPDEMAERMRLAKINHVILYDANPERFFAGLDQLISDPEQWPLLFVEGNLAVFGWRDPASPESKDSFRLWQWNLDQLALRPTPEKRASRPTENRPPESRNWWEAFWKTVPSRSIDRDEATFYLFYAEALRQSANYRHLMAWRESQSSALLGAAAGWSGPAGMLDAYMRLTAFQPLAPDSVTKSLPISDRLIYAIQERFAFQRDDSPISLHYLAIRSARRSLAVNPDDAKAYSVMGESYLRLLKNTHERSWCKHLPELTQLRQAQASAALNQALALDPTLSQAHLNLASLYTEMSRLGEGNGGFLDLALAHLRAYQALLVKNGPSRGVDAAQFREQQKRLSEELDRRSKEVEQRINEFTVDSPRLRVLDRAILAFRKGLAGKALNLLLESDIAAFGSRGMALELELLLRTGRSGTVLAWTGSEQEAGLGYSSFHWLKTRALASSGAYALAQEECNALGQSNLLDGKDKDGFNLREALAMLVGQAVLNQQPGYGDPPYFMRRPFGWGPLEFQSRVNSIVRDIKLQADAHVLLGLLALEEGDADIAELAFRSALSIWNDNTKANQALGMDFGGRVIAQDCLQWLDSLPRSKSSLRN
jgi:hypothetical protein